MAGAQGALHGSRAASGRFAQSNKAKEAVQLFDAIHSIDRPRIAKACCREMAKQGRRLKLFVQVNTGEEPQKAA